MASAWIVSELDTETGAVYVVPWTQVPDPFDVGAVPSVVKQIVAPAVDENIVTDCVVV